MFLNPTVLDFDLLCLPTVIQLLLLKQLNSLLLVIILISHKLFYMPQAVRVQHQEASCRIQALWYNVLLDITLYHNTVYILGHDIIP